MPAGGAGGRPGEGDLPFEVRPEQVAQVRGRHPLPGIRRRGGRGNQHPHAEHRARPAAAWVLELLGHVCRRRRVVWRQDALLGEVDGEEALVAPPHVRGGVVLLGSELFGQPDALARLGIGHQRHLDAGLLRELLDQRLCVRLVHAGVEHDRAARAGGRAPAGSLAARPAIAACGNHGACDTEQIQCPAGDATVLVYFVHGTGPPGA